MSIPAHFHARVTVEWWQMVVHSCLLAALMLVV